MKVTCHPRLGVVSDSANSPVGFCNEQPAAAGISGRRGSPEYQTGQIYIVVSIWIWRV